MTKEQLLGEVEDVLRASPGDGIFESRRLNEQTIAWLGRAAAVFQGWANSSTPNNYALPIPFNAACDIATSGAEPNRTKSAFYRLIAFLHQARADLQMELGRTSVVVPQGQVFAYFDELRKVIEAARSEIFFVDPYLDAEFVSRYLPHVAKGVPVRLLWWVEEDADAPTCRGVVREGVEHKY